MEHTTPPQQLLSAQLPQDGTVIIQAQNVAARYEVVCKRTGLRVEFVAHPGQACKVTGITSDLDVNILETISLATAGLQLVSPDDPAHS